MTEAPLPNDPFEPLCSINRHHGKPDSRWHLHDRQGVTLFAALDLWTVLEAAFREGFSRAFVNDDGALYLLTIVEIE